MNKFVFIIAMFFSFLGFSQERVFAEVKSSAQEWVKSKESGIFEFNVSSAVTEENIEHSAQYYTLYFSVEYLKDKGVILIKMKENTTDSRKILIRFFTSAQIEMIKVSGEEYGLNDFYQKFLL